MTGASRNPVDTLCLRSCYQGVSDTGPPSRPPEDLESFPVLLHSTRTTPAVPSTAPSGTSCLLRSRGKTSSNTPLPALVWGRSPLPYSSSRLPSTTESGSYTTRTVLTPSPSAHRRSGSLPRNRESGVTEGREETPRGGFGEWNPVDSPVNSKPIPSCPVSLGSRGVQPRGVRYERTGDPWTGLGTGTDLHPRHPETRREDLRTPVPPLSVLFPQSSKRKDPEAARKICYYPTIDLYRLRGRSDLRGNVCLFIEPRGLLTPRGSSSRTLFLDSRSSSKPSPGSFGVIPTLAPYRSSLTSHGVLVHGGTRRPRARRSLGALRTLCTEVSVGQGPSPPAPEVGG